LKSYNHFSLHGEREQKKIEKRNKKIFASDLPKSKASRSDEGRSASQLHIL
jgi:hypothetical protein